jgi:hypothetical protein
MNMESVIIYRVGKRTFYTKIEEIVLDNENENMLIDSYVSNAMFLVLR